MWTKSKSKCAFCALFLITVMSATSLADTIRLKDGSILKGKIVSFRAGNFVVEVGEGVRKRQLTYAASEVESITFDNPPVPSAKPASLPAAKTVSDSKIVQSPKVITTDSIPRSTAQPKSPSSSANSSSRPIEWAKKVPADNTNNGWTNSGWVVKKGQRIHITADGIVSLGKGQSTSPSGNPLIEDGQKLMKSVATGALLAVIGDDNNDFIYIGAEREFTAERDGALFLGINEGNLLDNSGAFDVKIEIIPDGAR